MVLVDINTIAASTCVLLLSLFASVAIGATSGIGNIVAERQVNILFQ